METTKEKIARLVNEKRQLMHTVREICRIYEFRAKEEEYFSGKVTHPPCWVKEAKKLLKQMEETDARD